MNWLTRARGCVLGFLALAGMSFVALPVAAQTNGLGVELNKLEPQGTGCRAYIVVKNDSDANYSAFKLEIILFQQDDVIARRVAVDLAPLKPQKRTVKLFDFDNTACDKIGSVLINEVMDCKTDAGAVEDCHKTMTVRSLTNVPLMK